MDSPIDARGFAVSRGRNAVKKRAIVTDSERAAKAGGVHEKPRAPLVGATFETAASALDQLPPMGPPEIAVAGRSNAGKSSAINALARHKGLAFASRTPGRTRQIKFFLLRGGARLADLPGYGYAAVPDAVKEQWQALLWQYLTNRATIVGLVLVSDARHGLKDLDFQVLDAFVPSARPVLLLATKSDKLNIANGTRAVSQMRLQIAERYGDARRNIVALGFAVPTGMGVDDADRVIEQWIA